MKTSLLLFALTFSTLLQAQPATPEKFQALPVGSITPEGWLKRQMQQDLQGFVGNLDRLVPALINDPIYGAGRLQKKTPPKDLGNLKEGDAAGDEQYKWWNSETQSNWWDGFLRHALLLKDPAALQKSRAYIRRILATQDSDGYLGIYDPELRYRFTGENGELWSKATLYRGLWAWYEATGDETVKQAVIRAVDNVMQGYPLLASHPFHTGTAFNGGVSHGLTFTDILERLYQHTRDEKYRRYALFLYRDFSGSWQSESDAQLPNILNPAYRLKSHGVHTYEHIRPLVVARYAAQDDSLQRALAIYLDRIARVITVSGGAMGDEWIGGREADATHTGYEYCSLQELLDSYGLLYQKTGRATTGDVIETIFYNAAQGARHPQHSAIAYLKTDNSYEMMGTRNGEAEPDRRQTRYKYSPAHQDVAVCCNPNAGRIAPYFLQHAWMKQDDSILVATLLMPNRVETGLGDNRITVNVATGYPYDQGFRFRITLQKPAVLTLKIRKPGWVKNIVTREAFQTEDDFLVIRRAFGKTDEIRLSFATDVEVRQDRDSARYFSYGALLYAKPIPAVETGGKQYGTGLADRYYKPRNLTQYVFAADAKPVYANGLIRTQLLNRDTRRKETVSLVPLGKTVLRQVTFPEGDR